MFFQACLIALYLAQVLRPVDPQTGASVSIVFGAAHARRATPGQTGAESMEPEMQLPGPELFPTPPMDLNVGAIIALNAPLGLTTPAVHVEEDTLEHTTSQDDATVQELVLLTGTIVWYRCVFMQLKICGGDLFHVGCPSFAGTPNETGNGLQFFLNLGML